MTVYAWIEYVYYDGLMTFSQLVIKRDPDSAVQSCYVRWFNSEASG